MVLQVMQASMCENTWLHSLVSFSATLTATVACSFRYEYTSGRVDLFGVYFTPLAPGVTRSFFKMVNLKAPSAISKFSRLPRWFLHNSAGTQTDQDAVMLHGQVYNASSSLLLLLFPFPLF